MNNNGMISTGNDNSLDLQMHKLLSYTDLRDIYLKVPLASAIINKPIKLALYGLKSNVNDYIDINNVIYIAESLIRNIKLYGLGVILPIQDDEDDISKPLLKSNIYSKNIKYNILDPLNTSITVENNPLSYNFQNIKSLYVRGKKVAKERVLALTNNTTHLYLNYNRGAFTYSGLSVLQNLYPVLNLLYSAIVSLERALLNSSTLILIQSKSDDDNTAMQMVQQAAQFTKQIKQDSTIILKNGWDIKEFKLENLSSITDCLNYIEKLIATAAGEIPVEAFLDLNASNGLNNNNAEMISMLNVYLQSQRNNYITPTIKWIINHELYSKIDDPILVNELMDNLEITYENIKSIEEKKELIKEGNTDEVIYNNKADIPQQ